MQIKYIGYGLGHRIGNVIYLNKELKKYPILHNAVLEHELNHSSGWDARDLLMDLNNSELKNVKREYWGFILTHPKSFTMFLPIMKVDGCWGIDFSMILIWLFFLFIGGLVLWKLL